MDEKKKIASVVLLVVVLAGGAVLYLRSLQEAPPPQVAASPTPVAEPSIRHPLPETTGDGQPALGASDALAKSVLGEILGGDAVAKLFVPENLVRRFVATIDALPQPTASKGVTVFEPVDGAFRVAPQGDRFVIDARNHERYAPYVRLAEAADAKTLFAAYVRLYPLFQAAYEELGYPGKYFNDRVVEAIDDLLAAPEVASAELVQPKALYVFADPDLEARSAGQKIMIRMGPENAARVKARLRALREELTRGAP